MNETDRSILRELLSYCKEIERRIERFEVNEEKFVEDTALFDMLFRTCEHFSKASLINDSSRHPFRNSTISRSCSGVKAPM